MPDVRIPVPLRPLTGDQANVTVAGSTAGEVIDGLLAAHPDLSSEIISGDGLSTSTYESINLLIGREDMNELEGRDTPVDDTTAIKLLRTWPAAISGGKQWNQPVGAEPPE